MQVQNKCNTAFFSVFWEFLTIPDNMSHLEVMPAYESVQDDINVLLASEILPYESTMTPFAAKGNLL